MPKDNADDYLLTFGTLIESGKDLNDLAAIFRVERATGEDEESFRTRILSTIGNASPQSPK